MTEAEAMNGKPLQRKIPPSAKKPVMKKMIHSWQLYVLLLPALLYLGIFHYAPMYGLQIAFCDYMPTLSISNSP